MKTLERMAKIHLQKTPKWNCLYANKMTKILLPSMEFNVRVEWAE